MVEILNSRHNTQLAADATIRSSKNVTDEEFIKMLYSRHNTQLAADATDEEFVNGLNITDWIKGIVFPVIFSIGLAYFLERR
jgi:hypothetical protein